MMFSILRKSIRARILLAIMSPLVLAEACFFYFFTAHLTEDFISKYESSAKTISASFFDGVAKKLSTLEYLEDQRSFLGIYVDLKGGKEFASWISGYADLEGVCFYDGRGRVLKTTPRVVGMAPAYRKGVEGGSVTRESDYISVSVPFSVGGNTLGGLNFWFSDEGILKQETMAANVALLLLALFALVSGALAYWVSSAITRPINLLASDSKRISSGELGHEICTSEAQDEVGMLANNFRAMRDSIREKINELELRNKQLALEIIERRKTENALADSEIKYKELFQQSPIGLALCDLEGRIVSANESYADIIGYSVEEVLKLTYWDVTPEKYAEDEAAQMDSLLERGRFGPYEKEYRRKDGSLVPVRLNGMIVERENEKFIWCSIEDITKIREFEEERRKLEIQLRHSQKMEALGTLSSGIAHDFNNLLQAILGYTQLLSMGSGFSAPDLERLGKIEAAAESASQLVKNILTFSYRGGITLEKVDFNEVINNALSMLERTIPKMIRIEKHLSGELPRVACEANQITQVVMNLGANAKDAMKGEGTLSVKTELVPLGEEFCAQHAGLSPGNYILLEIADNGSGMDESLCARVFEPFFTTKGVGEGTGLGLSTVYGIAKQHGGMIDCVSAPGKGTTFSFYLPLNGSRSKGREEEADGLVARDSGGEGLVLIVDDEEMVRDLARAALEAKGFRIIEAESGEEAIEKFEKTRASGEAVELVVLDLGMPGMGGAKCLQALMRLDPSVKVLVASGYSQQSQGIIDEGACGFIAKPYRLNELAKAVEEVVAS